MSSLTSVMADEGIRNPEDLGALAPNGKLSVADRASLLRLAGSQGDALIDEAVKRARAMLLPAIERRVAGLGVVGRPATPSLMPLKPKQPPLRSRIPSQRQIEAAEKRIHRMILGGEPKAPPAQSGQSLRAEESKKMEVAVDRGMAILFFMGDRAPRFRELNLANGAESMEASQKHNVAAGCGQRQREKPCQLEFHHSPRRAIPAAWILCEFGL